MTLAFHALATIFPSIEGKDFEKFVENIRRHGVIDKIDLLDGKVLEGRNRYRALVWLASTGEVLGEGWGHRAGLHLTPEELEPDNIWFKVFNPAIDGDPLSYVISKNLTRRHLTDDQRRMVGARLVNVRQGRPAEQETSQVANITRERAAEIVTADIPGIDRARSVIARGVPDVVAAVEKGTLSVSAATSIARLPEAEQPAALELALPSGNRAIMASRQEPADSLDYFPTPPWATRALIEDVLPQVGRRGDVRRQWAWEPACGEGHIGEVLREYFGDVHGSDVHEYGYGDVADFLDPTVGAKPDWIITNPPFGDKTEAFVLRALEFAKVGVAMFVRLQWLETIGRYERLFRDRPPTLIAFFCERVNLCKGRWDPEGSTATAYIWLVWVKGAAPRAPFWIPPGRREVLSRPDDVGRFTAHPVIRKKHEPLETDSNLPSTPIMAGGAAASLPESIHPAAATDQSACADPLDIPAFLRRAS